MSQNYKLVGATTYSTSKAIFTKGGVYSAETLGDLVEATIDGTNEPMFVPVNESVTPPPELENADGSVQEASAGSDDAEGDASEAGEEGTDDSPAPVEAKRHVAFGKKAKQADPESDIAV